MNLFGEIETAVEKKEIKFKAKRNDIKNKIKNLGCLKIKWQKIIKILIIHFWS